MNTGKIIADGMKYQLTNNVVLSYSPACGLWTAEIMFNRGNHDRPEFTNEYSNYSLSKVLTRIYEMGELTESDLRWLAPTFQTTVISN